MRQAYISGQSFLLLCMVLIFVISVNGQDLNNKSIDWQKKNNEQVIYAPFRENLKLYNSDTIINSKSHNFSDSNSTDLFRLIVRPGFVKNSKSEFQIKSNDGTIIYSKVFDSFALVMRIFESAKIPKGANFETDREDYDKSATPEQYRTYFDKNVQNFFDNITFIDRATFIEILKCGNVIDKEALSEIEKDSLPNLIHLNCFNCDTGGGSILYFSKKENKVIEILGHD